MGVPLRSEWHSLVYFDRTAGKYAPDYIYLGDELVFESENRRELREAMQKIANNLAADRREQGTWKELVSFEGSGNEKTESFKTHWTGFRLRFKYFYEFSVRVYEGSRLIKTVTINRDHQAPEFVDVPAGEYTLRIQSDNPRRYPWRVFVEE
jgi:hypothetical protein